MKTEVTFIYKNRMHRAVVNCLNPQNGGAQLFYKFPQLDPARVAIIQCIGGTVIRKSEFGSHKHTNHATL